MCMRNMELPESLHPLLLGVAVHAIRAGLRGEAYAPMDNPDPLLMQPAGCFVSLHDHQAHQLRGCIGSLDASRPLLTTLISSARSVLDDPRFIHFPVTLAELPQLQLELSILSPLKLVLKIHWRSIRPPEGIYLTIGSRTGCFLPQVARETGWNKEQLLFGALHRRRWASPSIAWENAVLEAATADIHCHRCQPESDCRNIARVMKKKLRVASCELPVNTNAKPQAALSAPATRNW